MGTQGKCLQDPHSHSSCGALALAPWKLWLASQIPRLLQRVENMITALGHQWLVRIPNVFSLSRVFLQGHLNTAFCI